MKNIKKYLKKIIIIITIIIILILIYIFSLSYTINKNNNYIDKITKEIKENYKIKEDITYSNLYGNYYIFTTKSKVIVLNKEYEEVLNENISTLANNDKNYALIYKTKKLMYEETIIKNNKVTYNYYDAKTYKKVSKTTLERQ